MAVEQTTAVVHALSRLLGWAYFLCWSFSFYPQVFINYRRKSVTGLALDYFTINVFGFVCYAVSSLIFLVSPIVRDQYARRHPKSPEPTVRWNDFAFAAHATVMAILIYSQFFLWGYERHITQKLSRPMLLFSVALAIVLVVSMALVGFDGRWEWLDVIYTLQTEKLVISVVKYLPQAYVNYQRKSTVGWSIQNILLDLSGSILSLAQLVLDSSLQNDWSGLTGNPVKFFLSQISILFDIVFILQHYVFYRKARNSKTSNTIETADSPEGPVPPSKRKRSSYREEEGRLFGRHRFSGYNTMADEEETQSAVVRPRESSEEGERRALLSSAFGENITPGFGSVEEVGSGST